MRPVILLGAGASIDAGLFDTNRLTKKIYEYLKQDRNQIPAQIFGYVISKVISRKVREGASPFAPVNVEEIYDALEKLNSKNSDILSEFVNSWDPFLYSMLPQFDGTKFVRKFAESFQISNRRSYSGDYTATWDSYKLGDAAKELDKVANRDSDSSRLNILPNLVDALVTCLHHDSNSISYMRPLAQYVKNQNAVIGSLNYDLVTENALQDIGLQYDYGLSSWNKKKIVRFHGQKNHARLVKIHGSMNWIGDHNNILIGDRKPRQLPLMIFGSLNSKLRPEGPFLQLRHEFEKNLMDTNRLLIIGYSFGDLHLNAILQRWVSTRRKAKMVVIDPGKFSFNRTKLGQPYVTDDKHKLSSRTVEVVHMKKNTSHGLDEALTELEQDIDLTIPKGINGSIPDIWTKIIT